MTKPTEPHNPKLAARAESEDAEPAGTGAASSPGDPTGGVADGAARESNGAPQPSSRPRPPSSRQSSKSTPAPAKAEGGAAEEIGKDAAPASKQAEPAPEQQGAATGEEQVTAPGDQQVDKPAAEPAMPRAEASGRSTPVLDSAEEERPSATLPPPWQRVPEAAVEPEPARPAPSERSSRTSSSSAGAAGRAEDDLSTSSPGTGPSRPAAQFDEDRLGDDQLGEDLLGEARTVTLDAPTTELRPRFGPDTQEGDQRPGPGQPPGGFPASWPRSRRPRQASLQLKRLDPWSVLKIALVLAVVLYLIWLVAVGVLYGVLDGIGVWDRLNGQYADLVAEQGGNRLISAGRVFGVAAVIGAVNSLLVAVALSVGAFIYNVSADLVGGIELTLSERD